MTKLSLLTALFALHSTLALAVAPKSYEFRSAQLSYDGKLTRLVLDYYSQKVLKQTVSLDEGDEISVLASHPKMMDAAARIKVRVLEKMPALESGEDFYTVYQVEQIQYRGETNPGSTEKFKVTVKHKLGLNGKELSPMDEGTVTAEKISDEASSTP